MFFIAFLNDLVNFFILTATELCVFYEFILSESELNITEEWENETRI